MYACVYVGGGALKCYVSTVGGMRGVSFPRRKHYEDVRFNVISSTRGGGGCQISRKKRYVTLELLLCMRALIVFKMDD